MCSSVNTISESIMDLTRTEHETPHKAILITTLNNLNSSDRALISSKFCQHEWNIGSLNVLLILQNSSILSASEYILSQVDLDHMQLVLNDMLEFKPELFGNIVANAYYNPVHGTKLKELLKNIIKIIVTDLQKATEYENNIIEYMKKIKNTIPDPALKMLNQYHWNAFLESSSLNLKEAFNTLHVWRSITEISKNLPYTSVIEEITDDPKEILPFLFHVIKNPNFTGWKFYVIFQQFLSRKFSKENGVLIKRELKDLLKRVIDENNERHLYILFLTARAIYGDRQMNKNLETYNQWYKNTFGDIKFLLSGEKFKELMNIFISMVELEMDPYFLKIHVNTAISAPPLCNEIVINYKAICKGRLSFLTKKDGEKAEVVDSIVIGDD